MPFQRCVVPSHRRRWPVTKALVRIPAIRWRQRTNFLFRCRLAHYSSGHFYGKPDLLDVIGMPFAPKVDQDLRQPPPKDSGPVHPGMAAGAERHQLGVVAGIGVIHILYCRSGGRETQDRASVRGFLERYPVLAGL